MTTPQYKSATQSTFNLRKKESPNFSSPPSLMIPNCARNKLIATPVCQRVPASPIINGTNLQLCQSPRLQVIIAHVNDNDPKTPLIVPKIGRTPINSTSGRQADSVEQITIKDYDEISTKSILPRINHLPTEYTECVPQKGTLLQPGENPWYITPAENSGEIKIAAITPIGTIAMVPTIDKRPPTPRLVKLSSDYHTNTTRLPPTPGKHLTLMVVDEVTGQIKEDPLFTATIYLDCTKPEDRDYNYVALKMRSITQNTISLQKQYINELRPLVDASGCVSHSAFDRLLSIYENNQVYYQDRIDDNGLDIPTIKARLTELEHWFMCIIEPKSEDDVASWQIREKSKLTKGVSPYCDTELYPYIGHVPINVQEFIARIHATLF